MSTAEPVRELKLGQLWTVWLLSHAGFIGEVSFLHEQAVAFVIQAVVAQNIKEAHSLLGQVIVVPRQPELWGFLGGPR